MTEQLFRKLPVDVAARQVPTYSPGVPIEDYLAEVLALAHWCGGESAHMMLDDDAVTKYETFEVTGPHLFIVTLEGPHAGLPGDWIIRGVEGEFYPCKLSVFESTYAPVGEPTMLDLVAAERASHPARGYDAEHDDGHVSALVLAAVSYGIATAAGIDSGHPELMPTYPTWDLWPWPDEFWKPSADELRNLVKGASLILAAGDALMAERRKAADA